MKGQFEYWSDIPDVFLRNKHCQLHINSLYELGIINMVDTALKQLSNGPKCILEIGGGSQIISRYLLKKYPSVKIVCTDLSKKRIDMFSEYHDSPDDNLTILGDINAANMPFEDESFDLIIGDAMLHHIDHLKPALFEINRCLKKSGKAIFVREPVIGALGVLIYKLFLHLKKIDKHILGNYIEHKRVLSQWYYEFYMSGFEVKTLRFWKNQKYIWRIRSIFPRITPCYLVFVLEPKIRIKDPES